MTFRSFMKFISKYFQGSGASLQGGDNQLFLLYCGV
jgi:hypothetical protein